MAQKYVAKHDISLATVRPARRVWPRTPSVAPCFGPRRSRRIPAVGQPVQLPFSANSRETWIYKDDCAEQMIRLALTPQLAHFAYNNGGDWRLRPRTPAAVRHWLPDAKIDFDESKPTTPLTTGRMASDWKTKSKFKPRPLREGVRAHINQARLEAGLQPV